MGSRVSCSCNSSATTEHLSETSDSISTSQRTSKIGQHLPSRSREASANAEAPVDLANQTGGTATSSLHGTSAGSAAGKPPYVQQLFIASAVELEKPRVVTAVPDRDGSGGGPSIRGGGTTSSAGTVGAPTSSQYNRTPLGHALAAPDRSAASSPARSAGGAATPVLSAHGMPLMPAAVTTSLTIPSVVSSPTPVLAAVPRDALGSNSADPIGFGLHKSGTSSHGFQDSPVTEPTALNPLLAEARREVMRQEVELQSFAVRMRSDGGARDTMSSRSISMSQASGRVAASSHAMRQPTDLMSQGGGRGGGDLQDTMSSLCAIGGLELLPSGPARVPTSDGANPGLGSSNSSRNQQRFGAGHSGSRRFTSTQHRSATDVPSTPLESAGCNDGGLQSGSPSAAAPVAVPQQQVTNSGSASTPASTSGRGASASQSSRVAQSTPVGGPAAAMSAIANRAHHKFQMDFASL